MLKTEKIHRKVNKWLWGVGSVKIFTSEDKDQ